MNIDLPKHDKKLLLHDGIYYYPKNYNFQVCTGLPEQKNISNAF